MRTYLPAVLFIICWWAIAFVISPHCSVEITPTLPTNEPLLPDNHLSELQRHELLQALQGDAALMMRLITRWEKEADRLIEKGYNGIVRLSREKYRQAHLLSQSDLTERPRLYSSTMVDDGGRPLHLSASRKHFLPHTYASAAILMALLEPEQIVALPLGIRHQSHLYPQHIMDKIPFDTEGYDAEKIYLLKPDVAFIAYYSQPATVEALKNQGVALFELNTIQTPEEIIKAIQRIGEAVGRPWKGELLAIFTEALFYTIDNRMKTLPSPPQRTLYLNYFTHLSTPSPHTITAQLLKRLGVNLEFEELGKQFTGWSIPLDQEALLVFDPECLIVASCCEPMIRTSILAHSAFRQIKAIQRGNVHVVDHDAQQSPSQYIALAYFDLFQALARNLSSRQ